MRGSRKAVRLLAGPDQKMAYIRAASPYFSMNNTSFAKAPTSQPHPGRPSLWTSPGPHASSVLSLPSVFFSARG